MDGPVVLLWDYLMEQYHLYRVRDRWFMCRISGWVSGTFVGLADGTVPSM